MALAQRFLGSFRLAYEWPRQHGEMTYAQLIDRDSSSAPQSYRWIRADQQAAARKATGGLIDVAEKLNAAHEDLEDQAPRPLPDLRVRPRV